MGSETAAYLKDEVAKMLTWSQEQGLAYRTFEQLHEAICKYLDHLFFSGLPSEHGDKLLVGLSRRYHQLAKGGPQCLYKAKWAMRGFRKLSRAPSRMPMPRQAFMALVGAALARGLLELAVSL